MTPRVLYVVPYKVTPADTGPKQYFRTLLEYAQSRYHCEILQFRLPSEASRAQKLPGESLPPERFSNAATVEAANSLIGTGFTLSRYGLLSLAPYSSSSVSKAFTSVLHQRRYDLVHLLSFHTLPLRKYIPSDVRSVLTAYNAFSLGNYRSYSVLPRTHVRARLKYFWISRAFARLERNHYRCFDAVSTVSEVDTAYLRDRIPMLKVQTVIIPVAARYLLNSKRSNKVANRVLVMGLFGHAGIAQGALESLSEVPNLVEDHVKPVEFVFWSRSFTNDLRQKATRWNNVRLVGYVEDYLGYLDSAAVCVFPQRCDSGTQVKVQQAMARGLPVVATPEVLAGVEANPGEHALVFRSPKELTSTLVRLLTDRDFAVSLGERGKNHIATNFTVERMGGQLSSLYRAVLERAPAGQ